jgi:uncharacterized protein (DUF924 family)
VSDWADQILDFWFALPDEKHWQADPELDSEIRRRFRDLWAEQRQHLPERFLADPRVALAAVILFDQLPRNMFRRSAEQFATDHLARAVAAAAVDRRLDEKLTKAERGFLYMPFMHSEALADQRRSLALFTALGNDQLGFARKHHDVIERFGRFPHRNTILGRKPRPEEEALGADPPW